ncbi:MAG TPA: serine hydrolase domain-containing protein [Fontimonas sp.]
MGSVTTVADEDLSDARTVDAAGVERIWRSVEAVYRSGAHPGISLSLRHHGKVVLNRSIGHAAGNGPDDSPYGPKRPMLPDTPVCVFSASKAITAILMHKLAEEGGIKLDERVSHFIPEFAEHGKAATTISQVLSHRGGFPMFNLPKNEIDPAMLLDWERCVDLICRSPAAHGKKPPRQAYHAITGGFILAEILQRVTQRPIGEYLNNKIRKPLGMRTFTYGLAPEFRPTVALNYVAGAPVRFPISVILERALMLPIQGIVDVSNSAVFHEAVVPSGNLYCTADELSRFYQMLLDHGEYEGVQVLKPRTVARAVRPASMMTLDRTLMIPMRYSEGLMLGANPVGLYGPMSGRAFGHLGFLNILAWADPQRQVAISLQTTGKAVLGAHLLPLVQLMTAIGRECQD